MSEHPAAAAAAQQQPSGGKRRTNAAHQPRSVYQPGQYDHLLTPKPPAPAAPGDLRGVTFAVSASGLSIIATEQRADGRMVKHLLVEYPYYIDIALPDGRSVQVEARMFEPRTPDPEEPAPPRRKRTARSSAQAAAGSRQFSKGSLRAFGSDAGTYVDCGSEHS